MKFMKKNYFLFFSFLLSFNISAQISIEYADAPMIGDVLFYANDSTVGDLDIGMAGMNQVWDFSNLENHFDTYQNSVDPTGTPGFDFFPESNLAFESFGNHLYLKKDADKIQNLGLVVDLDGMGTFIPVRFNPEQTLIVFPTTFGTSFNDTSALDLITELDPPVQGADSIRIRQTFMRQIEIDAYGEIMLPQASFDGLRQKESVHQIDSIWAHVPFLGGWFFVSADESNYEQFTWLAKEANGPIVELSYDEMGNITNAAFLYFDAPQAAFSFENFGNGAFQFEDESINNPTEWEWSFGDGMFSSDQNPDYQYTANGIYEVCLTVTNPGGSNTVCDTVEVLLSPVAGFDCTSDPFGIVDFTDLSQNDPDSWAWDFGDGGTSTEQNPQHTFLESDMYEICLIASNAAGSDTTCVTKDIIISSTLEREGITQITVFPNPINDNVKIELNNPLNKEFRVKVSNSVGINLFEGLISDMINIESKNWESGYYNIQLLNSENQIIWSDKLLKVK